MFLVPTCLLVAQQARAVQLEIEDLEVKTYMGGHSVPTSFDVLVSTPASFISLSDSRQQFQLSNFSLVIFDEVHHVVKRHPYRSIARRLSFLPNEEAPRILGLTASLTYHIG